ncbi:MULTISPECIES: phenylalanine--tRNA ligase subunit alpha [Aerococcus]|uniref:Phenylalanine--tRNA ligase alpha subunit n=1 Tax=Aerococcus tenax TaxID=3078812 RepID=A0A5N1BKK2_9LACT|nr:phenylalanine--tRNA ligase subunit alpha [Aerococcus urinae]KAA9240647.1 phenylalanine--tRNA ligase subunit alpha [Aerococcus urinae]MDK7303193.1 phenylalanine--tRNA ligase subunit alpha [Aerococcus urinae]MDK7802169.1 phenylalanine--tRNA ligase subunit alpha [Aerococcus urinae]MDK8655755.1 phenylalanine--tRNA ligase subunit alpha [Aerococcus urinae]RAV71684.1 phenylalanine--tRNA ligase subunit alpha [Aerococcus urinae]
MDIISNLQAIEGQIAEEIQSISSLDDVQAIRVKYLGKKGPITEALRHMKDIDPSERPKVGAYANELKNKVAKELDQKQAVLEEKALNQKLMAETIDVTLPGKQQKLGSQHVISQVMEEIEDLFLDLGYIIVEGPEIESDYYNFKRMNLPEDHPARDMQDTFYIEKNQVLLRTHTSPVQAHAMDQHDFSKGPLQMISPGKVYRRDSDDATHSHQFHQIEGLVVDKNIGLSDLKGTLELFARHLFGADRQVRLRPSYFPFTEPSVEIDISCFKCGGQGCNICKKTGWIEILGGGMVHPNVLEMSGIDSEEYSGFAFGLGPDRVAMLKYGIEDIRHFYQNDLRFIHQFQERG